MSGIACFVTSTRPNTLVSKSFRHTSAGITSSGRLSLSTPALFTSTRRPVGQRDRRGIGHVERGDREVRHAGEIVAVARVAHRRDRVEAASPRARARPPGRCPGSRPSRLQSPSLPSLPLGRAGVPLGLADEPSRTLTSREHTRCRTRPWTCASPPSKNASAPRRARGSPIVSTVAFAKVRGRGGPGDEHELFDERLGVGAGARPRRLDRARLAGRVRRPRRDPRRAGDLLRGVRARRRPGPRRHRRRGPARADDRALRQRRPEAPLPSRASCSGTEIWCQGYSEPNAGSDLANVQTRAERDGDEWVVTARRCGRRSRTGRSGSSCSAAPTATRRSTRASRTSSCRWTSPASRSGRSCRSPGTASSTRRSSTARAPRPRTSSARSNGGWRVAMGTLAFERGASTLGQQLAFENELRDITDLAQRNGLAADPVVRQRLADAWMTLRVMRFHALRTLPMMETRHRRAGPRRSTSCSGRRSTAGSASSPSTCSARPGSPRPDGTGWRTPLPLLARRHDLRRLERDPEERDRRAGARPAEGADDDPHEPGDAASPIRRPEPARRQDRARHRGRGHRASGSRPRSAASRRARASRSPTSTSAGSTSRPRARRARDRRERHVGRRRAALLRAVIDELGPVDVLVNNAGLGGTAPLAEMTDEQWSSVLDVTLTGTMRMTRAALRHMYPRASGVIVNNASVVGWRAQEGQAHYAAGEGRASWRSPAARRSRPRTTACASTRSRRPSRCTPHLAKVTTEELLDELTTKEAFGRAAEPWEVANVIVFLASDLSSYMTGEVVSVSSQHP